MSSTTERKKTAKNESQSLISLDEIIARVMSQDPSKWSLECIQQCLMKLGQSISATKELLVRRIVKLKNNPLILDKIVQKRKRSLQLETTSVGNSTTRSTMDRRLESVPKGKLNFNLIVQQTRHFVLLLESRIRDSLKEIILFLANNLQTVNKKCM